MGFQYVENKTDNKNFRQFYSISILPDSVHNNEPCTCINQKLTSIFTIFTYILRLEKWYNEVLIRFDWN